MTHFKTKNMSSNETLIKLNTYIGKLKEQLIEDIKLSRKEILTKLKNLNFKDDIIIKSTNSMFNHIVWHTEFENEKFEMLDTVNPVEYGKITNELKELLEKIYTLNVNPLGKIPILHGLNVRHVKLSWNIERDNLNLHFEDITTYDFIDI